MALGTTTYKTPNAISQIYSDLTGKEGCGVSLGTQGLVYFSSKETDVPYGVVVVGGQSADGSYPGPIGGSAIEFVDQLGCVVQVTITSESAVSAGDFLAIDATTGDGTFVSLANQPPTVGSWVWGLALTNAQPNEQCVMRFQPYAVQYIAPPPPPPEPA